MDLNLMNSNASLEITRGPQGHVSDCFSTTDSGDENETASTAPTAEAGVSPDTQLSKSRFAHAVLLTLVAFVIMLLIFTHGVVIDTDVRDEFSSSSHVNHLVEIYQVINGHVAAALSKIVEQSFEVFVVVAVIFLRNVRWFPGDDPSAGAGRLKMFLLWTFPRVTKFYMAIAFTAMYVGYTSSGVDRAFLQEDLMASNAPSLGTLNVTAPTDSASLENSVSVLDTVLRGAVKQQVAPFKMSFTSGCAAQASGNSSLGLPSIKEVRLTAVVYGFPFNDWNADMLPFGLRPTHTVTFQSGAVTQSKADASAQFQVFQNQASVSWSTMYELLVQAKLLYERSVSDSIPWQASNCSAVNGTRQPQQGRVVDKLQGKRNANIPASSLRLARTRHNRRRRTLTKESDEGLLEKEAAPLCYGARTTLSDVANMTDPRLHTLDQFFSIMVGGFMNTTPIFDAESVNLTIDKYEISSHLKLTSLTLDLPFAEEFRYTSNDTRMYQTYCNGSEGGDNFYAQFGGDTTNEIELEKRRTAYCDLANTAYLEPRAACGHANCIFLDQSKLTFKKQLQLMPYLTNCSTAELEYDADYLNWFPKWCKKTENAVFLFGLGSYMTAESFDSGYQTKVPFITKPKRHVVVSFAKLEWEYEDLSSAFGAECGVNSTTLNSQCRGLLYELDSVSATATNVNREREASKRVLVLGEKRLPTARMETDYHSPVQLASLNMRPFFYAIDKTRFEWEYLDLKRIKSTNWPETMKAQRGLNGTMCSPLVDSYIAQIEQNHWFMDDLRQPLYTAALFYLFQNAAVKTVELSTKDDTAVLGTTPLKGDLERHEIRFSIPLLSLVSTFIGLGLFLFVAVMAIVYPAERLKMTEDVEENNAQRYGRFLQDEYPAAIFTRNLKLVSGERVAADDYEVQSATLLFIDDKDKKIFL